jgi:catechol 2,3-dioxygenase-like lactoylglutathione lyase family enzyme
MTHDHYLAAIVPCNDLAASEAFYGRLGFLRSDPSGGDEGYVILSDGHGGHLHLTTTVPGWVSPGTNPFGVYLYSREVDQLATQFQDEIIGATAAGHTEWGMYEFAASDPNGTLVRVGWPSSEWNEMNRRDG